jgi:hypothetical protein
VNSPSGKVAVEKKAARNAGLLTRNRAILNLKIYIDIFGSNLINVSH